MCVEEGASGFWVFLHYHEEEDMPNIENQNMVTVGVGKHMCRTEPVDLSVNNGETITIKALLVQEDLLRRGAIWKTCVLSAEKGYLFNTKCKQKVIS